MNTRSACKALLLALPLGLALALSACDNAAPETASLGLSANLVFDTDGSDGQVDLIAGQNVKVGVVTVSRSGDNLLVTYQITAGGACITEWHLDAGTLSNGSVVGIPTNNAGPIPGQFMWKAATPSCVGTVSQTIPLSSVEGWTEGMAVVIAAHAVVRVARDADCAFVYGIEQGTGQIYKVYLRESGPEAELLFTPTLAPPVTSNWPNGLALNASAGRLYYTNTTAFDANPASNPLYFLNLSTSTQTLAGTLAQRSASATFVGSTYFYVPQNSNDDLRRVTFNADGTVNAEAVACADFTGASTGVPMFFGDIAHHAASGLIYGSARIGSDSAAPTFFSLNPSTCAYSTFAVQGMLNPLSQLAFDCSGNLTGHDTASGRFYRIALAAGTVSFTDIGGTSQRFNDLTEGPCACDGGTETAWGAGTRFRARGNWATYFTFTP